MKTISNELNRIKDIEISNCFRKDVGDVSDLAINIKNNGLIHPISVTKDGRLVAGRRRIEAFKRIGLEEIPVILTDIKIKEDGEINENSIKKDFTAEEVVAVKKYLDAREVNLESQFQIKGIQILGSLSVAKESLKPSE
jgi:ParB-like chromosome segregation protein Spo0J